MVGLHPRESAPPPADLRLDELAEILAGGVLRREAKENRFKRKTRLEFPAKTRLSVTTSDALEDCEVK